MQTGTELCIQHHLFSSEYSVEVVLALTFSTTFECTVSMVCKPSCVGAWGARVAYSFVVARSNSAGSKSRPASPSCPPDYLPTLTVCSTVCSPPIVRQLPQPLCSRTAAPFMMTLCVVVLWTQVALFNHKILGRWSLIEELVVVVIDSKLKFGMSRWKVWGSW